MKLFLDAVFGFRSCRGGITCIRYYKLHRKKSEINIFILQYLNGYKEIDHVVGTVAMVP